jgi:hypothetical protein
MKWLPFFICLVFFIACGQEKKQQPVPEPATPEKTISYNDTVRMPGKTYEDSGYFKGYIPEQIERLEREDNSALFRFLSAMISKKDIVLQDSQTLSHSVLIDAKTETRYDTMRNKQCTITSVYKFGKDESQQIKINGIVVKGYAGSQDALIHDDIIGFEENTFRHFSFKGKTYYYIQAVSLDNSGASMGNVTYHLVYDIANRKCSCFQTCRFGHMLFGDVDGDDQLDYLDFDNSEFCTTVPSSDYVVIQLYSCNNKGQFLLQEDAGRKPYFIEGKTGNAKDEFSQDTFSITNSKWPRPLPQH